MDMLRRFYTSSADIEERKGDGKAGSPVIVGYAAVFNSLSEDLGGFREKIEPGAFSRSLADRQDVRALFEHDPTRLLARSTSGTLALAEDKKGLRASIDMPDTQLGRDVIEMVRRGDIRSWSFGFYVREHLETKEKNGDVLVTLTDVDLREVSIVSNPAYPETSLTLNSIRYRVNPPADTTNLVHVSAARHVATIQELRRVANRQKRRIM